AIICAVSPALFNYNETKSTLEFASRAKCVKNKVSANIYSDEQSYIRHLEEQLAQLQAGLAENSRAGAGASSVKAENTKLQKESEAMRSRIDAIESSILRPRRLRGNETSSSQDQRGLLRAAEDEAQRGSRRRHTMAGQFRDEEASLCSPSPEPRLEQRKAWKPSIHGVQVSARDARDSADERRGRRDDSSRGVGRDAELRAQQEEEAKAEELEAEVRRLSRACDE
ncbi:unnamed protein product, partial [Polarella glacialis]